MKRWAVIENDIVTNIIVWDGLTPLNLDYELVEIPEMPEDVLIGIGASYDGTTWTPWNPEDNTLEDLS